MENKSFNVTIDTRTMLNAVWIALVVYALVKIKSIILVLLTSVAIASFIGISASYLEKRAKMNRTVAVVLMYLLTVGIFGVVFYFFIPVLLQEMSHLVPFISQFFPQDVSLQGVSLDTLDTAGDLASEIVEKAPLSTLAENIGELFAVISSGFTSTISAFFGGVTNVLLVAVISFYLSISKDGISNFLKIITPIQNEKYVISLWERSQRKIALWMSGQVVLGVIIGLLTFVGLYFLRVEYAVILAVVAGLFELIPFGIFLAAIPAVSLAFASGGISLAVMVVLLYIIIQQLEGYIIAPLIVQKATGISPLVVILSVLIGITLAGFWGLILAIPVAVTILEYVKDLELRKMAQKENV